MVFLSALEDIIFSKHVQDDLLRKNCTSGEGEQVRRHLNLAMTSDTPLYNDKDAPRVVSEALTALMCAARFDNVNCVRQLIEAGKEVGLIGKLDLTALLVTCIYNSPGCFKLLYPLERNMKNSKGATPYIIAAAYESKPIVEQLHDEWCAIRDFSGKTALMYAAEAGNGSIVHYIIQRDLQLGRDRASWRQLGAAGSDGRCALDYAISIGNVKCVALLLPYESELCSYEAVRRAIRAGNCEIVSLLCVQRPLLVERATGVTALMNVVETILLDDTTRMLMTLVTPNVADAHGAPGAPGAGELAVDSPVGEILQHIIAHIKVLSGNGCSDINLGMTDAEGHTALMRVCSRDYGFTVPGARKLTMSSNIDNVKADTRQLEKALNKSVELGARSPLADIINHRRVIPLCPKVNRELYAAHVTYIIEVLSRYEGSYTKKTTVQNPDGTTTVKEETALSMLLCNESLLGMLDKAQLQKTVKAVVKNHTAEFNRGIEEGKYLIQRDEEVFKRTGKTEYVAVAHRKNLGEDTDEIIHVASPVDSLKCVYANASVEVLRSMPETLMKELVRTAGACLPKLVPPAGTDPATLTQKQAEAALYAEDAAHRALGAACTRGAPAEPAIKALVGNKDVRTAASVNVKSMIAHFEDKIAAAKALDKRPLNSTILIRHYLLGDPKVCVSEKTLFDVLTSEYTVQTMVDGARTSVADLERIASQNLFRDNELICEYLNTPERQGRFADLVATWSQLSASEDVDAVARTVIKQLLGTVSSEGGNTIETAVQDADRTQTRVLADTGAGGAEGRAGVGAGAGAGAGGVTLPPTQTEELQSIVSDLASSAMAAPNSAGAEQAMTLVRKLEDIAARYQGADGAAASAAAATEELVRLLGTLSAEDYGAKDAEGRNVIMNVLRLAPDEAFVVATIGAVPPEVLEGLCADTDAGCWSAAMYAAKRNFPVVVAALPKAHILAQAERSGSFPLLVACKYNSPDVVAAYCSSTDKEMLKEFDLRTAEDDGRKTALMVAAERNHAACVAPLVAAQRQVLARDAGGNTALICAAMSGAADACRLLVRAEYRACNADDRCAMSYALDDDCAAVCAVLAPYEWNMPMDDGKPVMFSACAHRKAACVEQMAAALCAAIGRLKKYNKGTGTFCLVADAGVADFSPEHLQGSGEKGIVPLSSLAPLKVHSLGEGSLAAIVGDMKKQANQAALNDGKEGAEDIPEDDELERKKRGGADDARPSLNRYPARAVDTASYPFVALDPETGYTPLMYCAVHGLSGLAAALAPLESGYLHAGLNCTALMAAVMYSKAHDAAHIVATVQALAPYEGRYVNDGFCMTALMMVCYGSVSLADQQPLFVPEFPPEVYYTLALHECGCRNNESETALMLASRCNDLPAIDEILRADAELVCQIAEGARDMRDVDGSATPDEIETAAAAAAMAEAPETMSARRGRPRGASGGADDARRAAADFLPRRRQPGPSSDAYRDVRMTNEDNVSALMIAAKENLEQVTTRLGPVEARLQTENGNTALMISVHKSHQRITELLAPLELGVQKPNGWTALMLATIKKNRPAAECLVQASLRSQEGSGSEGSAGHSELNVVSVAGKTATMLAVISRNIDIVSLLAPHEGGKMSSEDGNSALMLAVKFRLTPIVEILAHHKRDFRLRNPKNGLTALMYAAIGGFEEIVSLLMPEMRIQCLLKGYTALMYAIEQGHVRIIRDLCEHETGFAAIQSNWQRIPVDLFSFKGSQGDWKIQHVCDDVIKALRVRHRLLHEPDLRSYSSKAKDDVNEKISDRKKYLAIKLNHGSKTALMIAAERGDYDTCVLLHGKEKGYQDDEGWTALMYACMNGYENIITLLSDESKIIAHESYNYESVLVEFGNGKLRKLVKK